MREEVTLERLALMALAALVVVGSLIYQVGPVMNKARAAGPRFTVECQRDSLGASALGQIANAQRLCAVTDTRTGGTFLVVTDGEHVAVAGGR